MSMKYIRDYYGVPAKRGARVRYFDGVNEFFGVIVGSRGSLLRVRFDGEKGASLLHPTWWVEYLTTQQEGE